MTDRIGTATDSPHWPRTPAPRWAGPSLGNGGLVRLLCCLYSTWNNLRLSSGPSARSLTGQLGTPTELMVLSVTPGPAARGSNHCQLCLTRSVNGSSLAHRQ